MRGAGDSTPRPIRVGALGRSPARGKDNACGQLQRQEAVTYLEKQKIEEKDRCPTMTMVKSNEERQKLGRRAELDVRCSLAGRRISNTAAAGCEALTATAETRRKRRRNRDAAEQMVDVMMALLRAAKPKAQAPCGSRVAERFGFLEHYIMRQAQVSRLVT